MYMLVCKFVCIASALICMYACMLGVYAGVGWRGLCWGAFFSSSIPQIVAKKMLNLNHLMCICHLLKIGFMT